MESTCSDSLHFIFQTITAGARMEGFGFNVAINKDDAIFVGQFYDDNIFMFTRNTTGFWALVDQLYEKNKRFFKLSGNFLGVIVRDTIKVYKVNGTTGISRPALHNFTHPAPSNSWEINPTSYDLTEDAVVIGEKDTITKVYPMKSGVQSTVLNASWQKSGSEFGGTVKMFEKVIHFVRAFFFSSSDFCYQVLQHKS